MTDIIQSKGWNWDILPEDQVDRWKNPAIESFYLVNRWKGQGRNKFLDLGCGLGRHTILFAKNGFETTAFDIDESCVDTAKKWSAEEKLSVDFAVGDMLNLSYTDGSFDCIYSRNAISHTDTNGMHKIAGELRRVLRPGGECYLTLGSKSSWMFHQDWPLVDANTNLCMIEGHEYKVPHFYADYGAIKEIFAKFKIELIEHIGEGYLEYGNKAQLYHYHVLIRKV
ncbi:MAG: class I SAM-dependent methyltransferase [Alphaproteobacteria bacterium]|nr:class I SAM-dependent methyltransferase [Alphaproteobacteria bacterium]